MTTTTTTPGLATRPYVPPGHPVRDRALLGAEIVDVRGLGGVEVLAVAPPIHELRIDGRTTASIRVDYRSDCEAYGPAAGAAIVMRGPLGVHHEIHTGSFYFGQATDPCSPGPDR